MPNLAQAASQLPVSTVYSRVSSALSWARASSRIAARWQGKLSTCSFVDGSHWPSHLRSTEQSSHRLGREACSTGVRRSPAIDASKRVRTIACSGLVVPTVQTGGCVLELFSCLWLPAGLTSEVMIPVSVVSGRADGGGGLLLHSALPLATSTSEMLASYHII